jgi:hypothetical protein
VEKRLSWQRRTLPHRVQCSTIRAHGLNCRVRDGAGWTPMALATNKTFVRTSSALTLVFNWFITNPHTTLSCSTNIPYLRKHPLLRTTGLSPRPLVLVSCTHYCASTSSLSNWWSPSGLTPFQMGSLILRWASHLDAFSGYPLRSSLPSPAVGTTTGTRALRPPRSSRTRGSSPQTPNAHSG